MRPTSNPSATGPRMPLWNEGGRNRSQLWRNWIRPAKRGRSSRTRGDLTCRSNKANRVTRTTRSIRPCTRPARKAELASARCLAATRVRRCPAGGTTPPTLTAGGAPIAQPTLPPTRAVEDAVDLHRRTSVDGDLGGVPRQVIAALHVNDEPRQLALGGVDLQDRDTWIQRRHESSATRVGSIRAAAFY